MVEDREDFCKLSAVASRASGDGGMTGATALFPATCGFGQQGQLWSQTGESLISEERENPSNHGIPGIL